MQVSRTTAAAILAIGVALLTGVLVADGAPSRQPAATMYEYDVRMVEHSFIPGDKDIDAERQLLNRMAASSWELVEVATYPPAEVSAGIGRLSKDRLTRYFYFRRELR